MIAQLDAERARLAAVERELAELGTRHDLVMSSFKFDEARDVQQRIAVLERRAELVAALPAAPPPAAAPVPVVIRSRRPMPRRR
jgi:hypothetical protein